MKDLMSQAYSAMRYNRRRTALTMLGMAWGIATVVLLLAYGAGFGRAIQTIFESWGTRIIGVFPGRTSQQAGGQKAGTKIKFTIDDLGRITSAAPLVNHISPEVDKDANVARDVRTYTLPIVGAYPSYFNVLALKLAEGRLINGEDEEGARSRSRHQFRRQAEAVFRRVRHRTKHPRRWHLIQGCRRACAAHAGGRR